VTSTHPAPRKGQQSLGGPGPLPVRGGRGGRQPGGGSAACLSCRCACRASFQPGKQGRERGHSQACTHAHASLFILHSSPHTCGPSDEPSYLKVRPWRPPRGCLPECVCAAGASASAQLATGWQGPPKLLPAKEAPAQATAVAAVALPGTPAAPKGCGCGM
jgi:hypothetical protein